MYELLENEYNLASKAKVFIKRQGKLERYYVPILSLRQSGHGSATSGVFTMPVSLPISEENIHQAKLKLSLDIKVQPHKLYWELPEAYRQKKSTPKGPNVDIPIIISPATLPTTVGKHQIDFTVQCNTSINSTIDVKLIAEDRRGKKKLAGAFRIWKNREKRPKIVLVNVESNITGKKKEYKKEVLKNRFKPLIRKYLQPSLVCPIIVVENLDMTSSLWHKDLDVFASREKEKRLCVLNESPNNLVPISKLYNRLRDALEDEFNDTYNDYIKIFYIKETAVRYEYDAKASAGRSINSRSAKFTYRPFYAASLNGANTILFTEQSDFDDSVSAHEIYHALGLVHSFSNYDNSPAKPEDPVVADGRYTYQSFETDNVMDYKTLRKPNRSLFGMWWWQWRMVNP